MKQRFFAVLLASALILQLAGCAEQPSELEGTSSESVSEQSLSESSPAPEAEGSAAEENTVESEDTSEPSPESSPAPESSSSVAGEVSTAASPASSSASASSTSASQQSESEEEEESKAPVSYPAQSSLLSLNPGDITIYVQDPGQFTLSDFSGDAVYTQFADAINGMTTNPGGAGGGQDAGFLAVRNDYAKFSYSLTGGALNVEDSVTGTNTTYTIDQEVYNTLTGLSNSPICGSYAQWLIYMRPSRVVNAQYIAASTEGVAEAAPLTDGAIRELAEAVRWIGVARGSGSTYTPSGEKYRADGSCFQVNIHFDSGVVYKLIFDGTTLYLESSDMAFGCQYTMTNPGDKANILNVVGDIPEPTIAMNPPTGKPVIYLYPERTTEVEVKLDFQGTFSYTYPAYQDGWRVTANPDGSLTNKADGSTHYYLFWDGTPDRKRWDFSTGFVVKNTELEGFFREKLPQLGLVPKEYNDFITYWVPILSKNPYTMITFSTAEYEATAPLTVTPAPDTVLRVHMVYKGLSAPMEIEEQVLPAAPSRKGFTVVEWGGTRAEQ